MKQKFDKALIFLNGNENEFSYLKKYINSRTFIIGCDGGTDKIHRLALKPHAVIGDFDSIKSLPDQISNLSEKYYGKELTVDGTIYVKYPFEKDFLDVELAVDFALEKGIKEIILANTSGEETDHVLGTLLILGRRKYREADIKILRPNLEIYTSKGNFTISGHIGDKVSLIPLYGEVKVDGSTGLKYDPARYRMSPQSNIGISNELTNKKATLHIGKGCFLVVHYHS